MRVQNNNDKLRSSMIELHGEDWVVRQRIAGQSLAEVMCILQSLVREKTKLSLIELSNLTESELAKRECQSTFKNYRGFPAACCISVNKQLVHGIPTDYHLKDGDLVSFDFGATFEGAIADSATTMVYGEASTKQTNLINITQKCLYEAIKEIKIGKHLGVIGHTINKIAGGAGYNVIHRFGGHGITWDSPHAEPFVSNKASLNDGIKIQPGLTIAIEPLVVPGDCSIDTELADDGWTICTKDISAHVEHSLHVHQDHVEIMTWRPDEEKSIPRLVYFN